MGKCKGKNLIGSSGQLLCDNCKSPNHLRRHCDADDALENIRQRLAGKGKGKGAHLAIDTTASTFALMAPAFVPQPAPQEHRQQGRFSQNTSSSQGFYMTSEEPLSSARLGTQQLGTISYGLGSQWSAPRPALPAGPSGGEVLHDTTTTVNHVGPVLTESIAFGTRVAGNSFEQSSPLQLGSLSQVPNIVFSPQPAPVTFTHGLSSADASALPIWRDFHTAPGPALYGPALKRT